MALTFSPSARGDLGELRRFLALAFELPGDAPFVEPRLIDWKWFAPRPLASGPRSYVLKQDSEIAAHGCSYPVTFLAPDSEVTSARVIDWAGGPKLPGSGVLLFRKFARQFDTLLAVGGSEETQAILPKIGMARVGEMSLYARPVRPLRQEVHRPHNTWRAPARMARNWRWKLKRPAAIPSEYKVVRVDKFNEIPTPVVTSAFTPGRRTPEFLNYALACPAATVTGYEIHKGRLLRGYFLLSRVNGQTRIADVWTEGDWNSAIALAAREAAKDPDTLEVTAVATTEPLKNAIEAAGFQPRGSEPVFLFDPKGKLAGAPPLHLQLLDGDEWFLNSPEYPFWT